LYILNKIETREFKIIRSIITLNLNSTFMVKGYLKTKKWWYWKKSLIYIILISACRKLF